MNGSTFYLKSQRQIKKMGHALKKNPTSFPWPIADAILSLFFKLEIRKAYTYECDVPF